MTTLKWRNWFKTNLQLASKHLESLIHPNYSVSGDIPTCPMGLTHSERAAEYVKGPVGLGVDRCLLPKGLKQQASIPK